MKPPVLVIDDEPDILASLQRLLRREFQVYAAASGAEGLSILAENEIHAILTDQRMPSMTGTDVLSDARHNHPDAIRILFTGYADLEDVIRAVNNGEIYRYIVKPWNPEELISVVREACERYDLIISRRKLTEQLQEINAELEARVQQRTAELADANARAGLAAPAGGVHARIAAGRPAVGRKLSAGGRARCAPYSGGQRQTL